jgi:uncharacterized protein with PIN domain
MSTALFRFYEELNDFLPKEKKKTSFSYSFTGNPSVKDAIEALGIPHVEVDMVLVKGTSVGFDYRLRNDDQISVYPVFESLDISQVTHLREKPLRDPKFIPDVHLGRLAKNMRLCGLDTHYSKDLTDPEIIKISLREHRIILTRDKGLLKNRKVTHGYWVRSIKPEAQLKEVLVRFDLKSTLSPFTRCLECNRILTSVAKEEILDLLQPRTKEYYDEFKKCPACEKIFWEGSHFEKMKIYIYNLINEIDRTFYLTPDA